MGGRIVARLRGARRHGGGDAGGLVLRADDRHTLAGRVVRKRLPQRIRRASSRRGVISCGTATRDSGACLSAPLPAGSAVSQSILLSIFGVANHWRWPSPFGGNTSKSIRQMPPFRNSKAVRAPIRRAASSPRL